MADTLLKISQLDATDTAPGNSYIPIDDGTLTKKIKVSDFNSSSTGSAYNYAVQAADSANEAKTYRNAAAQYASDASGSAIAAESARTAAETAQNYAEAAQGAAEGAASQAASSAATMTGYAEQVAGYVSQASSEATRAQNAANLAAGYASGIESDVAEVLAAVGTAEGYAESAGQHSLDSEAFASGKRNGIDVESGDPAFQNNSKYYKDLAESAVSSVESSVSQAQGYANDALSYKNTAQSMSASATLKATESGNHALDSEAWATGKRNNVDVGSSDATFENNSKYYSQQSASSASDAATASANATYVMEQISTMIGAPTFTVDITTGEVIYTMDNVYGFNINQATGELEWEVVA